MRSAAGSRTSSRSRLAGGLFEAYLQGELRSFYGAHFADLADRRAAVGRALRPIDPALAGALERQGSRLPADPTRDGNLERLRHGAAAVVTGQQMGLFLGPLFTLYKAATAVKLASVLEAETGRPVVPVFWMQDEDHDLPEIASCAVPMATGDVRRLSVPASPDSRVSVAHLHVPPEVEGCLGVLREELGNLPHAREVIERLAGHYRPGARWSEAFAGALADVFAGRGLVILDPRDPAIAALAARVFRRAIAEAAPIAEALRDRVRELEEAGFAAQVHVRPGSPLPFVHPAGPAGPRFRLEARGAELAVVGGEGSLRPADLLELLAADPLHVSSSALLRPAVQDSLLPTAAYVAGPSELGYFAQLPPLYHHLGMEMPLVAPRARVRVLEDKTLRICERLGVRPDDAVLPEDELLARGRTFAGEGLTPASLKARLLEGFDAALAGVSAELRAAGEGLEHAERRTRAAVEQAVDRLAEKLERALLHRDHARVEDVRRLRGWLAPDGEPQERAFGLPYLAARFGDRGFLDRVIDRIDPLDASPVDLLPERA